MSEADTCKRVLEFTVPADVVESETARVVAGIQKRVRLPGFRPGKAPANLIRSRYASQIRQEVLESLLPKIFSQRVENENLRVVGEPRLKDVRFQAGEPLTFQAEFEVAPEVELGEYVGLTVPYREPEVTEEAIARRLDELRDQKADYVNVDPRPVVDGDYAVISLQSLSGVPGKPIQRDELMLHVGAEATLTEFSENLRGLSPGEEKEFDVRYPDIYSEARLAGNSVHYRVSLKGIRHKELPELNDEFAADVGDFKSLGELREEVRKGLLRENEIANQMEAKTRLVQALVDAHDFAVPDAFIDRQIEMNIAQRLSDLAAQGVDPRSLNLDWHEVRKSQRDRAVHDVRASILLNRIAEREAIETLQDEVDREVHRIARQQREPAAAVRKRMEDDGSLGRLASRIRTEKVLNFLFEKARKVAPEDVPGGEAGEVAVR